MLTATLLFAISIFDYLRHRIPNHLLVLLLGSLLIDGDISVHPYYAIFVSVIALFSYWMFGLGAGDVKLLFLIALFLTPAQQIASYWFCFTIIGVVLILLKFITTHSWKGDIALAPAICGAVLCISLLSKR